MSKKLVKSTSVVASMTLISRVLGFVRDVVIASVFGASVGADAFFVAFKIPNLFRRLFAEGAFSQTFVPTLSHYREQHTHERVKTFLNHMVGLLAFVLICLVVIGVVFAPAFITVFTPGFIDEPARFELTTTLLRVCFPYIFFISLTACAGAILNSYDQFAVPAVTPVLLNLSLISCAFWLSGVLETPVMALAYGVLIAGVLQFLFQLPFLKRRNLLPRPRLSFKDKGVNTVLKRMVPALFGVSVAQLNILVDTIFASFLKVGSISWLYYSDRLVQLPLGVFGVAVGTVILPHLSRKFSNQDVEQYSHTIDWAVRSLLLVGLPAVVGLSCLAGPMLSTLFQYGKFNSVDVNMAQQSLMAFSLGLQFLMLIKVFAAGFYAQHNISTPVKIAAFSMGVNVILNAILIAPLAHAGIALATSASGIVNAVLLAGGLYRRGIWRPGAGWYRFLLRAGLANGLLAAWLLFFVPPTAVWVLAGGAWRALHLAGLIGVGAAIYFGVLALSGLRPRDLRL